MPRTRLVGVSVLVLAAVGAAARPAAAQEVRWRHDYAAARREAAETGRALLLDFGTEACFWCKKLDATTFRDPKVVRLLNERFITVKIDGNKQANLTQAMRIDGFPTLILATPDGKVIDRHSGYLEAADLVALLGKAPAPTPAAQPAPPKPAAAGPTDAAAEERRAREKLDADLAALHPGIAAALDRPANPAPPQPR